ncbi:uncharacterized protein [Dermacentor albipictus]|uniref:uncharacterized protein isoform X1 n=1 Tax=Dermacentor albipictus TaxID=60249 RepID=UPI0038FCCBA6
MRRGQSPLQLPPCPRPRPAPVPKPPAIRRCAPVKDTSGASSCPRYSCFVLLAVLFTTATLLATPALLLTRLDPWRRDHFTLDEDLQHSRDYSVHPCDDFYRHVCSSWNRYHPQGYWSPLAKYQRLFDAQVIKRHLLRHIPKHPVRAQDKASALLVKCLSQRGRESSWTLEKFLLELGLSWPRKTSASRPQLLGTLVKSSLHFGMPIFWAFFVGRHPSHPNRNIIYTTFDDRTIDWVVQLEWLIRSGKHGAYLRRCAEIVGGTGQSYSSMIHSVTTTHFDIGLLIKFLWNPVAVPAYLDLSDPELRRALNGHLADDSQLWPEDEIVNLQPRLFAELNATYLSHNNFTENFELYLGAYTVWLLLPYVSNYLTTRMLEDIGLASFERSFRHHKCMQALEVTLPLAKWKVEYGGTGDKTYTWKMLRLTTLSFNQLGTVYGDAFRNLFSTIASRLAVNEWNMTLTWDTLDSAYAYVPFHAKAGFFDLYIRICMAGIRIFKKSLQQPRLTVIHTPGIATSRLYRILVAREVVIENFLRTPPLFDLRHPLPVLAAFVATLICKEVIVLGRLILYHDEHFKIAAAGLLMSALSPPPGHAYRYPVEMEGSSLDLSTMSTVTENVSGQRASPTDRQVLKRQPHAITTGPGVDESTTMRLRAVFVQHDLANPIFRQLQLLVTDLGHYDALLKRSGVLANYLPRERQELKAASYAALIASNIPRLPEAQTFARAAKEATAADRRLTFRGFPEDQLYFLVRCFSECGGDKIFQRAICNLALPSVPAFRRAFKCKPYHRLVTNFTWSEPNSTTHSASR